MSSLPDVWTVFAVRPRCVRPGAYRKSRAGPMRRSGEFINSRKAFGRQPAGISAVAPPVGEFTECKGKPTPRTIGPGQPVGALERLEVGEPAVLVALQPHTPTPAHLRHLFEREHQHLAVLADNRHQFAVN